MRLEVFIIFLIYLPFKKLSPFNVAVMNLFYNFQIMQALFGLKFCCKRRITHFLPSNVQFAKYSE